jgi:spore coat protein JC
MVSGGPDGELGAANRYLSQRYTMPYKECKGILTDVGTEELGHSEMISAIVYQLTRNLSMDEIKRSGFDTYFVDHTTGVYPIAASGVPFDAKTFAVKGDAIADLVEDLAAEQKARVSYDNILRLVDDPDVRDPIKFLREREIVHFQRFGDALRVVQDNLDSKNFYAYNPSFDNRK